MCVCVCVCNCSRRSTQRIKMVKMIRNGEVHIQLFVSSQCKPHTSDTASHLNHLPVCLKVYIQSFSPSTCLLRGSCLTAASGFLQVTVFLYQSGQRSAALTLCSVFQSWRTRAHVLHVASSSSSGTVVAAGAGANSGSTPLSRTRSLTS